MKTMKIILLSIICFSFLYAEEEKKPADMDALLAPSDRLEYGGYRILRICEFKEGVVCKYVVSKNGINLASFPEDNAGIGNGVVLGDEKGALHPDFLKTGLIKLVMKKLPEIKPVLKNLTEEITIEKKVITGDSILSEISAMTSEVTSERSVPLEPLAELVFMSYSGGAHCCWDYTVYTLDPEFKEVFDSYAWGTGYGVSYADLDNDGTQELIQSSLKYDYAFGRPHMDSAFPLVIFKYNEAKKQYFPANRQYKKYLLEELKKIALTRVDNEKEPWMSPLIMHVLTYLYLGMDKEAWELFNKNYKLKNKEALKKDILATISKDPVYIFLSAKQK